MDAFLMMPGARKIIEVCVAMKPGEKVLVVTDSEMTAIADVVAAAAHERGGDVAVMTMPPREIDGDDPPALVAAAMKQADIIIAPVSRSISHSTAVNEALAAGARMASLAAFTKEMMIRGGIEADFTALRPTCDAVARRFTQAKQARLTTPAGTDLVLELEGRPGNSHACIVDQPGKFTAVPNIEANISPLDGKGEGVIVFDGSIPNLRMGPLRDPVRVTVRNGTIVDVSGGREASIIKKIWAEQENAAVYNIAQLAVGLNPHCIAFTGVFLNDHGAFGTAHIGIGTSTNLGGTTKSPMHFDGMMHKPTLLLDGQPLLKDGELVL